MDKYWKISNTSQPHYLELEDLKFIHTNAWPKKSATVKWDGCIHLFEINSPVDEEGQYWHICDINEMIARLTELRDKAREHFGECEWH